LPFLSSVFPPPKRRAGPTSRGFWAFTRPGVPGASRRISTADTGCSLGLRPCRVCRRQAYAGFRPRSSHTLRSAGPKGHCRRRPGVSIGCRRAPSRNWQASRVGQSNPRRVLAPARSRPFERDPRPGYLLHLASRRTSPPTGRCCFGRVPRSTAVARDRLRRRASRDLRVAPRNIA